MDASPAPPMAPKDEWEPFREEIGQRYEAGTLKSVKEYMETNYRFPDYSLSTWKKKIHIWGFDRKNNKASEIVDVVAHFDQCPGESSLVPFILPSGRKVSLNEMQRYLRRRRQVYANGQLVKTTPANAASASTALRSQRRPLQDVGPRTEAIAKRKARQRQLVLRRLYAAFLFGQGFVRPTDLMAPKSVQNTITFLGAFERCLVCSWEQNMWAVDDEGYMITTSSVDMNYEDEMFAQMNEAMLSHVRGDYHKARVLLYQWILSFHSSLMACPGEALKQFLDVFGYVGRSPIPAFILLTIKLFNEFLGKVESTYIGLRSLFGALSEFPPEDILLLVSQARKVWCRSLEHLDKRLAYYVTVGRVDSINEDQSLDIDDKVDALTNVLRGLETGSKRGLDATLTCHKILSLACFQAGQLEVAEKSVERGLRFTERVCNAYPELGSSLSRIGLTEENLKIHKANFLYILALVKESQGDIAGACQILEEAVGLYASENVVHNEPLRYLAELQQKLGDEQAFLTTNQNYDRAIEGLMTLHLDETHLDESDEELDSLEEQGSNERSSEDGDEMQLDSQVDANVERQFHDYMNGRPYDTGKPDGKLSVWQEGIDPSVKQDLMLTVSDVEDLEEL